MRWLVTLIGWSLSALLMAAPLALIATALWFWPGPSQQDQVVLFERGQGLKTIAKQLEADGLIRSRYVFAGGVFASGLRGDLKAGEYNIPARASMAEIAGIMASGQSIQHQITVVEGTTVRQVKALFDAETALSGEMPPLPDEGTLAPNTYFFTRGDTRAALLARMTEARTKKLATLWAARDPQVPLTSPQEALTLASVVEKETGIVSERRRIAGVFYNRLRQGMRLQSDPTAIYPLSNKTGDLGRALTRKDLQIENAYNTYMRDGLPIGPIAIPSDEALEAVLHPETNDFLYFVADGTGGHAFAKDLDTHNRNVARWREINKAAP